MQQQMAHDPNSSLSNQQQQQFNQQMVLCPVRVVYETQILMPPGDQMQPNQTYFINPQNQPPWINQNSPMMAQNQMIYVQQMPQNNMMPQQQGSAEQAPMYIQQSYPMQQVLQNQNVILNTNMQERQIRHPIQYANVPTEMNMVMNQYGQITNQIPNIVQAIPNVMQQNTGQLMPNIAMAQQQMVQNSQQVQNPNARPNMNQPQMTMRQIPNAMQQHIQMNQIQNMVNQPQIIQHPQSPMQNPRAPMQATVRQTFVSNNQGTPSQQKQFVRPVNQQSNIRPPIRQPVQQITYVSNQQNASMQVNQPKPNQFPAKQPITNINPFSTQSPMQIRPRPMAAAGNHQKIVNNQVKTLPQLRPTIVQNNPLNQIQSMKTPIVSSQIQMQSQNQGQIHTYNNVQNQHQSQVQNQNHMQSQQQLQQQNQNHMQSQQQQQQHNQNHMQSQKQNQQQNQNHMQSQKQNQQQNQNHIQLQNVVKPSTSTATSLEVINKFYPNLTVENRKRKSESPDECRSKMPMNIPQQVFPVKQENKVTERRNVSEIGVNTVTIHRPKTEVEKISVNHAVKQANDKNENVAEIKPEVQTDKLLRNTVYAQARARNTSTENKIFHEPPSEIKTDIEKNKINTIVAEKKTEVCSVKPEKSNVNTISIEKKIEVNPVKPEIKVNTPNTEVKEIIKERESKKSPEKMEVDEVKPKADVQKETEEEMRDRIKKEINDDKIRKITDFIGREIELSHGNKTNKHDNSYVLTHVLDGIVIQESNVAFPIRLPLKEKILPNQPAKLEAIKTENKEVAKAKETTETSNESKILTISQINLDGNVKEEDKSSSEEGDVFTSKPQIIKKWTSEELATHLSKRGWGETASILRDHEIDGEALFLVTNAQLVDIGISEGHAALLSEYVKS